MKSHVDNFDIPMSAYNLAQVADLIGIYISDTLGRIVNLDQVELYRDDRIFAVPDSNRPKTPLKYRRRLLEHLNYLVCKIEIASNLRILDFLDVIFNLNNNTFKPFSKSNSAPTYLNSDFNYRRSLLKQIPNVMNQRINRLSSHKRILEESKSIYDKALKNSRFQGEPSEL